MGERMARLNRRWASVVVTVVIAFGAVLSAASESGGASSTYSARLRTAIAALKVASENHSGYDRSKFPHWVDADHDGCDTREEVLLAEAIVKPHKGAGCTLTGGRWYSYYDNKYWSDTNRIDIDHVVALAEAWESGARTWTTDRRKAYAKDLDDRRTLVGVTDTVNAAKSADDPANWLPPVASMRCRYVRNWVAIKIRWWLTVNNAEKNALTWIASGCPNDTLTVTRTAKPGSSTSTTTTTQPPSGNCSPSYPTVCIPPPPPDLDCGEISYRNFTVVAPDPHGFDGDHDGVGCET
jgi:Protein of unknown function (DUF1524)